jgi:hypothetical protein
MTRPHRFRFGLLGENVRSATELMETARRAEATERLVRERRWEGLPVERVLEMPSIFIGSIDQIVDDMQKRRERYGISYYVVSDRSLEMVAPIVARLAGV